MALSRDRRIEVGVPALPQTFEIGLGAGAMMENKSSLYSSLVDYRLGPYADEIMGAAVREQDRFVPALAESWSVSEDGRTYRFRLREGAMSAAGNELTADDVKYTIDRGFNVPGYYSWTAQVAGLESNDDVHVLDKRTVEFRLRAPSAFFLDTRVFPMNGVMDRAEMERHASTDDPWSLRFLQSHDAGFGAFTIDEYVPDRTLRLRARKDFWKREIPFDIVNYRVMPDEYDREARLALGDFDYVHALPPSYLLRARERTSVRVALGPSTNVSQLSLQCAGTPFENRSLRRAVAYAIPYETILRQAFLGIARPWKGLVPPVVDGYDESRWPYYENPERAKEELAKAAPPAGFSVSILGSEASPAHRAIGMRIAAALGRIGLPAAVEIVGAGEYVRRRVAKEYVAMLGEAGPMVPDAGYALAHDFCTWSEGNDFSYSNPDFDALVSAGLVEQDREARLALYRKAQRLLAVDVPCVPLAAPGFGIAVSRRLQGVAWYPDGGLRFADLTSVPLDPDL